MKELTVTDVRALPGDAAFLIDDGSTSILYDTGFGFTGAQIAENIRKHLGTRDLDYIFLTHSHYDHALGCGSIIQTYPNAKVVAAHYAKYIFEKPSARAVMLDMDRKAALQYGIDYDPNFPSEISVDIPVSDGDEIVCGDLSFTAVALPGHTKCSMGFYCREQKLLLGTETLGVFFGNDTYLPSFLVGYEMTLASFAKAKTLEMERMVIPHYGAVGKAAAADYLKKGEAVTVETAKQIRDLLRQRKNREEILELFTRTQFPPHVAPVYPLDAFLLNTGIMIRQVEKELMGS
jgi:glyoxylase-like metal-dependent hydrolase (beta-lactamase superfamily II)